MPRETLCNDLGCPGLIDLHAVHVFPSRFAPAQGVHASGQALRCPVVMDWIPAVEGPVRIGQS